MDELFRALDPASMRVVQDALRVGVAESTDQQVVAALVQDAPVVSATEANVESLLTDIAAALGLMTIGSTVTLFLTDDRPPPAAEPPSSTANLAPAQRISTAVGLTPSSTCACDLFLFCLQIPDPPSKS